MDCESVWNLVFGRFPAELFDHQFLAHEFLRFIRLNLESLQLRVPQYSRSFPNLLKVKSCENASAQREGDLFDRCILHTYLPSCSTT